MTPIQQMLLGLGASKKTYLDDLFSTYLWIGNATNRTITNGIDFSGEGGMVWVKNRTHQEGHRLVDTVRGATKSVESHVNDAEETQTDGLTAFNNNGFTLGVSDSYNRNTSEIASWSFRKAPGFFDIVTYTGNGTAGRTVNHSLGSVPGMILIKRTNDTEDWEVYHRSLGATKDLRLNTTASAYTSAARWNDTEPTSSVFTLGNDLAVNGNGSTYVAYVFAGGTGTTDKAVEFDGSGDYLTTNSSSDYTLGTGDFTLEYWYKPDTVDYSTFIIDATGGGEVWATYCNKFGQHKYRTAGTDRIVSSSALGFGQWHHIAIVRTSGTTKMYVNGVKEGSDFSDSTDYSFTQLVIGRRTDGSFQYDGKISNLRLVKGRALYSSNFIRPDTLLGNVADTVLLCCNNSSVTGTTAGTLTASGDPTVTTNDSLFDDSAGFVFGDSGDQNVIKCGSYLGNGSATGPEIYLGWEPQWVMIKGATTSGASSWFMYDAMRGLTGDGSNFAQLTAQTGFEEYSDSGLRISINSTGFQVLNSGAWINEDTKTFVFIAIRRSDPLVQNPPSAGTDVFSIDLGNSSTTQAFTSGFPVDLGIAKAYNASGDWETMARLMQGRYLITNADQAGAGFGNATFDDNTGFLHGNNGYTSDRIGYMWKRHAGFDVVTYTGTGAVRKVPHSLNKIPEMIWIKDRTQSNDWIVYHKGLDGGSNPQDKYLVLHNDDAEADHAGMWNDTAPTSTHFTLGTHGYVNEAPGGTGDKFIGMLFASVNGISKVGYYTGTGGTSQTISTGFAPRFVLIKRVDTSVNWVVLDTTRGWGSGNDAYIALNSNAAQDTGYDIGSPASNGFNLVDEGNTNAYNGKFIYYAHA